MEMAAMGVILSPFPKEEGETCHACYPSRHRFLRWDIGKGRKVEMQQEKTSELLVSQFV